MTEEQQKAIAEFKRTKAEFFKALDGLRAAFGPYAEEIEKTKGPDEAINYLYANMPDSSTRVFMIKGIMDRHGM